MSLTRDRCADARWLRALVSLGLVVLAVLVPEARAQCDAVAGSAWKTRIDSASDPFVRYGDAGSGASWVKFTMLACDTGTPRAVYFQNSNTHAFHYDFATAWLRPLLGMTRQAFDDASLRAGGQQALLGAVLFPMGSASAAREVGIQLVRRDAYSREEALAQLLAVRAALELPGYRMFYMPTYEQQGIAEAEAAYFEGAGFPIGSPARWSGRNAVYSEGWAIGTLKHFAAGEVDQAYRDGRLTPADILLVDGVPAELPLVAGVVSLSAATPNSHVAILSRTYGAPFGALLNEADRVAALAKVGRFVAVRAGTYRYFPDVDVVLGESITAAQRGELLALKAPPPLDIQGMRATGSVYLATDPLTPADVSRVGGKAAHYGLLRRAIPQVVRPGLGLTFDLWNGYMDQVLPGGRTLRQEIGVRLGGHAWPPNFAQLSTDLAGVRDLIRGGGTDFSDSQKSAVIAALQDARFQLDAGVKIRFRSSTNVEDTATFSGAGLYDSFSGCLADDLDGDGTGPSVCDPAEPSERGVFRAIKRVYASFYNENAFIQRLRLGVDESRVGMGVLVHHSFPDETELANGVAVLERRGGAGGSTVIRVTLQPGANSVTNPDAGVVPEQVEISVFPFGTFADIVQRSNLLQLGATVLNYPDEYVQLGSLLYATSNRYMVEGGPADHTLDFEFKKTTLAGPGLEIKQVRPLPVASSEATLTPFMLGEDLDYTTYQGESVELLGTARLATTLRLRARMQWLTEENRSAGVLEFLAGDLRNGCDLWWFAGPMASFPQHAYGAEDSPVAFTARHAWRFGGRSFAVTVPEIPLRRSPAQGPLLRLRDMGIGTSGGHRVLGLASGYASPVPTYRFFEGVGTTLEDRGGLCEVGLLAPQGWFDLDILAAGGERLVTTYAHPRAEVGLAAGFTAPVVAFGEAELTGLTTRPIRLTAPGVLTASPHHHNFGMTVGVEPARDPSVTAHQLRELRQRGAGTIIFTAGQANPPPVVLVPSECGPACVADIDDGSMTGRRDGGVTVDDLLYFLDAFSRGDVEADFDDGSMTGRLDGGVTVEDLVHYLLRYEGGC